MEIWAVLQGLGAAFKASATLKKVMAYALFGMVCFAWGNYHATQKALNEASEKASADFQKATGGLFNAYKGKIVADKIHAEEDRAKDQTAGKHAAVAVAAGAVAADRDHAAAAAQIAKEKPKEIVNASLSCPEPFSFSPDTRRLLDAAAGAVAPGAGPSNGGAAPTDPFGRASSTTAAALAPPGR